MAKKFSKHKLSGFLKVTEPSIARNLTIGLFLLVVIVEGSLLGLIYWERSQFLLQELKKNADNYAHYLSEILVVPIWDYDDEQIEKIGAGIAKNELVNELHIINFEGQTLYKYQASHISEDRIERSININHKGKPIGFAKLYLSPDVYKANLAWLRDAILLVLLGSLVVILITTGILLRYQMRNPIITLQKGLDRVARGDYEHEFGEVHQAELSDIASRIKEMALIIQKRELSLQKINEELKYEILTRKKEASDRLRLEKKLQQAQKMEALGTLAGGVAHDLNNILSGIVSYPELLLMDISDDSALKKPLLTIKKSGEKAATIVQDLLTLARRGVEVQEIINLNDCIGQYLKSPEFEILSLENPKILIETNFTSNLFNIKGSPVHLSKTVMNLISNAFEAMPDGGKVSISTRNTYIDLPLKGYDDIAEGDYVEFSIADTGVGIASKELNRIFEPFYTKKVMGRSGTGLGMAVVWGTVKDHQGYIDLESIEGRGTAFKLYFPVTRQQFSDSKASLFSKEIQGNGESILIVDDVQEQREIAQAILAKLGYQTTTVSSGEEAVEYLGYNDVDLLVLDMIMKPGMDGLETYQKIIKFKPEQKAIITSGFSETDRVKEVQNLGAGMYIKKPYNLEKIGMAIQEQLGK